MASKPEMDSPPTGVEAPPSADEPTIPSWVDEDHFVDIIKEHVSGFVKIVKFEPKLMGGAGENYASVMLRIKVTVEVEGSKTCICCFANSTKDVSFVLKTLPQGETGAMLIKMFGLFPKELAIYEQCLPEFTQMFRNVGQDVAFAPKQFRLKKDPETDYVLLEDLSPHGFKNINRLEGCDKEHTEAVLRLLAKFHAASAVRYELKGPYENVLVESIFTEKNRDLINGIRQPIHDLFQNCLREYNVDPKFYDKLKFLLEVMTDRFIELDTPDPDAFNAINHGDLWANNIMFRHNDDGKLEEVLFVDFQVSRYSSPAIDLFYFLLSSTKLELKVSHFYYFLQYYHDHLLENLELLGYPKKMPTMKDLHVQLLKHSFWTFSTLLGPMSAALLDPTKNASMDNFMGEGEEAVEFKMKIYKNPRFVKHFETVLPWLDRMGFLD